MILTWCTEASSCLDKEFTSLKLIGQNRAGLVTFEQLKATCTSCLSTAFSPAKFHDGISGFKTQHLEMFVIFWCTTNHFSHLRLSEAVTDVCPQSVLDAKTASERIFTIEVEGSFKSLPARNTEICRWLTERTYAQQRTISACSPPSWLVVLITPWQLLSDFTYWA